MQRGLLLEEEGQRREEEGRVRPGEALEPALRRLVVLGRQGAARLSRRRRHRFGEARHHRCRLACRAREAGRTDHHRDRGPVGWRGEGRRGESPAEKNRQRRRDSGGHRGSSASARTVSYTAFARPPSIEALFRAVVARRLPIVVIYALLALPAALLALRIPRDDAIERMIVASDPDVVATLEFRRVFPEKETVLLLTEADDPLSPDVVARSAALERGVARVSGARPVSALAIAERLRPGIGAPERDAELRTSSPGHRSSGGRDSSATTSWGSRSSSTRPTPAGAIASWPASTPRSPPPPRAGRPAASLRCACAASARRS